MRKRKLLEDHVLTFQMKYWKNCVNWDSGPVSRKCRLQTGYKMQISYKTQTAYYTLQTRYKMQTENSDCFSVKYVITCHFTTYPELRNRLFLVIFDENLACFLLACSRLSVSEDDRKSERATSGISRSRSSPARFFNRPH